MFGLNDGIVISRNVDVGQTVAASLSAPTIYVIADDMKKMQIQASVAEADIGRIKENMDGTFTVDAHRNDTFKGKVAQIRLSPTTVQNVVTYTVIINADNPDFKLLPGMTANVSFEISQYNDVVKIPNAALRFTPPGVADRALGPHEGRRPPDPRRLDAPTRHPERGAATVRALVFERNLGRFAASRLAAGLAGSGHGGGAPGYAKAQLPGWPAKIGIVNAELLPVVGEGVTGFEAGERVLPVDSTERKDRNRSRGATEAGQLFKTLPRKHRAIRLLRLFAEDGCVESQIDLRPAR